MKQTINFSQFTDAFREIRPDNFSYDGLRALYDWFESLADDTGVELELDVIAICCDFSEYENIEAFQADYGEEYETIEDIERQTSVIPIDKTTLKDGNLISDMGGFIIQQF